jgi:hypothetical protein
VVYLVAPGAPLECTVTGLAPDADAAWLTPPTGGAIVRYGASADQRYDNASFDGTIR